MAWRGVFYIVEARIEGVNIHDRNQAEIGRIAEVHFYLRFRIRSTLKNSYINPAVKHLVGDYDTEYDLWRGSFGDRFFDMATMIRLGTAVEQNLKHYYMDRKGHATLVELRGDRRFEKGIFQRVQDWQQNGAIRLYKDELGYDLSTNPHLPSMQEMMAHRHLYAHNSGLLDEEYVKNIERITGEDLRARPSLSTSQYPAEDVYWFEPLERLNFFIEEARAFFRPFP